ncbi:AAA family ATPase [Anaerosinus gibii]|uniref:AAA family ATPase n=1 Tax=Selenobaculum gibii TaxID=3054208 RepID=A0A9Y2AJ64_9FIRM|nr:AAA family ATPase [Selenobaculum gbiensis]WIW70633.1 AAA family ATPase [Selenobaculum gbiensis]
MENQELDISIIIEKVNAYLDMHKEISQEKFAKMAGISGGSLSSFLANKYHGRVENVAKKIMAVLGIEETRKEAVFSVKEPERVVTAVMKEMWFGLQYANDRNDVIVIYGAPGIGKTVTINKWVAENPNSLFFTASPNIRSGRDVMEEILEALNKKAEGRNKSLEKNIIAILKNTNRPILIDEAHFLRLDGLETLRRIYDATKCPLVLVGNPAIMESITERNKTITGQFFSRAVRIALDMKVKMEDVKAIVLQNGVELDEDCLNELYKVANSIGAFRIMVKLFLFAWTIANQCKEAIAIEHIRSAKKVIISV